MPIRWPWLTPPPEAPDPDEEARQRAAHDEWMRSAAALRAVLVEIDENVVSADREEPER